MIEIGSLTSWVVFTACVVGQSARTLLPYFNKMQTGEIQHFDMKFFATVLMAFAAALTPSMLFFPVVMGMIPTDYALMGTPFVFLFVVIAAYGANDIVNKGVKAVEGNIQARQQSASGGSHGNNGGGSCGCNCEAIDIDALASKIVEKQNALSGAAPTQTKP